jgi:uncharacterized membrane protein (DUF373 family)
MVTARQLLERTTSIIGFIIVLLLLAVAIYLTVVDIVGFFDLVKDTDINELDKGVVLEFIGAILLIIICLELVETVFSYSIDHKIRVEVVLLVGITAIVREIIVLDVNKYGAEYVAALGGVIIAIAGAYYLIKKGQEIELRTTEAGSEPK